MTTPGAGDGADRQQRAYAAAAYIAREKMAEDSPRDAAALRSVEASDVVVVRGSYDHVEQVLDALQTPYTAVTTEQLPRLALRPHQLLVINCPGTVPAASMVQIREFVASGGSLFTTDWALRHVIEPAFPGRLAYNERPTRDDVVRIEVRAHDNPFLKGVMAPGDDPLWWLEGSSYPIRILDSARVEVLLESRELADKYGEAPVAVLFKHGQGEVFHMISHYYLQRSELREARHRAPAAAYAEEKGVPMPAPMAAAVEDLALGEVEAAASSTRLFANIVADKKRRAAELLRRARGGE